VDLPLRGLRVLDLATIYAGPLAAMMLGDFGAEVIKVEHPRGDPMRTHGESKNGHGLWWKLVSRNKQTITLNLSAPQGQDLFKQLAAQADVLIENFRPGVMERWGLGYDELSEINPRLVMLRVTGFGQDGPYAARPGFGTLAESMSGFAYITGQPGGPPTLPPFGLADGVAGMAGCSAVLMALRERDQVSGRGQSIDLAITEPLLTLLGAQPTIYDQLGVIQEALGNRSKNSAPRNTYRTRKGEWVAISTSATTVAERVLKLVGHPEVAREPWFASNLERGKRADLLDELVGGWIALRDTDEVIRAFEDAGAAAAPVYNVAQLMEDPQYVAREAITTVADEDLGPLKMQNLMFRLSRTPGAIRWAGRRLGQDNAQVFGRLGLDAERLAEFRAAGVV
jgi:crotonobetainyl-CoA:carnitine CoA-transferase CaiB-like acyl-CoA transferase